MKMEPYCNDCFVIFFLMCVQVFLYQCVQIYLVPLHACVVLPSVCAPQPWFVPVTVLILDLCSPGGYMVLVMSLMNMHNWGLKRRTVDTFLHSFNEWNVYFEYILYLLIQNQARSACKSLANYINHVATLFEILHHSFISKLHCVRHSAKLCRILVATVLVAMTENPTETGFNRRCIGFHN